MEYVKGELMKDADALSRQYEHSEKTKKERLGEARAERMKTGKWNKRCEVIDGKEYWKDG